MVFYFDTTDGGVAGQRKLPTRHSRHQQHYERYCRNERWLRGMDVLPINDDTGEVDSRANYETKHAWQDSIEEIPQLVNAQMEETCRR